MTPSEQSDLNILPVLESDIDTLVALARAIWYRHYPDIISVEQIEYMLGQRYHPDLIRAQLASGRACRVEPPSTRPRSTPAGPSTAAPI